ncbi:MAG: hypothetical protein GX663_00675 [Clostridiales bacterium]|nr:hypothetical protein [Clostridiales bacterium]
MEHVVHNTVFGFCWWDLPAFLILVAVAVLFIVRHHNLKKRERELEDQLSEIYTNETVDPQQDNA